MVIHVDLVASGLAAPTFATSAPGVPDKLFITEKDSGRVVVLDLGTNQVSAQAFFDVPAAEMSSAGEGGLLGLAFHPAYATNGKAYLALTNEAGDSEIWEITRSGTNAALADPSSAHVVMTVDRTATNHVGGWIGFGPDGLLYIASGDSGGSGDPQNAAQNVNDLRGKLLRIDVNSDAFPADPARNYAIPAENPFENEVFAYGLRNPWRASFDRATGDLYIGDVGQAAREEIDFLAAGTGAGTNFGWRVMEGTLATAYPALDNPPPNDPSFTAPIYEYGRDAGRSIIGGYVYRGPGEAQGEYFFADFITDHIWTLRVVNGEAVVIQRDGELVVNGGSLDQMVSFAEDAQGRLYVIGLDGEIFRLTPTPAAEGPMVYQFSALSDGEAISFSPTADVLNFDQSIIAAADIRVTTSGANTRVDFVNGQQEVVKHIMLLNTAPAQLAISNVTFANGSRLLIGDTTTSTTADDAANTLTGTAGRDYLNGWGGVDTMNGGAGDDAYFVTAGDVISDSAGIDTVFSVVSYTLGWNSGVENLAMLGTTASTRLGGNGLRNALTGSVANNYLYGAGGDDTLDGGQGNDTLEGWTGFDQYRFSVAPGAANADTIVGFVGGSSEKIALGTGAHANLGATGNFTATDVRFAAGAGFNLARDSTDRVIYNTTTGQLWYDADGFGGAGAELIATLQGAPTLRAADIVVVSTTSSTPPATGGATAGNDSLTGTAGNDTIDGLAGNDTINGLAGNDSLIGGTGSDSLIGGDGNDTYQADPADVISDSSGIDSVVLTIDSTVDSYTLQGGLENLTIRGPVDPRWYEFSGNDLNNRIVNELADTGTTMGLSGGAGTDTLIGGAAWELISYTPADGHEVIDGGGGTNRLFVDGTINFSSDLSISNIQEIYGGGGDDRLTLNDTGRWVSGGVGNDTVIGGTGNDTMVGDLVFDIPADFTGNDFFSGGAGNDVLDGQLGDDTLDGGAGNDSLFSSFDDADTILFTVTPGAANADHLSSFHSGLDEIRLDARVMPALDASGDFTDGDERFHAGPSAEEADDRVVYNSSTGQLWYDANGSTTGGALLIATLPIDTTLVATDIAVDNGTAPPPQGTNGTEGNDTLTGTAGNDTIDGRGGDDSIDGLAGNDSLIGGAGNDVLGGGFGTNTLDGGAGHDYLYAGEDGFNRSLERDHLIGGDGDDTLDGGGGADTMDGGLGNDTYRVYTFVSGEQDLLVDSGGIDTVITVDTNWTLGDGFEYLSTESDDPPENSSGANFLAGNNLDNLINGSETAVARLEGRGGNDTLWGSGRGYASDLDGGSGNDVLDGGSVNDTLSGGLGNDTLLGHHGADNFHFAAAGTADADLMDFTSGEDVIHLDGRFFTAVGASGTFTATDERFHTGAAAAETDDRIIYDSALRQLWYDANGSADGGAQLIATLQGGTTIVATDITVNNGMAPPPPTGGQTITGTAGNDSLTGTGGNDTLDGLGGNDTLNGGLGDDKYIAQAGDVLVDSGGIDTLETPSAWNLTSSPIDNVTLTGTAAVGIQFNNLDNRIVGNSANNSLEGRGGNDTIEGGGGNDYFRMIAGPSGFGADVLDGGAGLDMVDHDAAQSGLNVNLDPVAGTLSGGEAGGGGGATLVSIESFEGGAFNDRISGNAGNNQLFGNAGNDTLIGLAGGDSLSGGDGNDWVEGGSGFDTLIGGLGSDSFVFTSTSGRITDFVAGTDQLLFENAVFTGLGAPADWAVGDGRFHASAGATAAAAADDRLIYNQTNGNLYYDSDGVGGAGSQLVTTLANMPGLTAADISVI